MLKLSGRSAVRDFYVIDWMIGHLKWIAMLCHHYLGILGNLFHIFYWPQVIWHYGMFWWCIRWSIWYKWWNILMSLSNEGVPSARYGVRRIDVGIRSLGQYTTWSKDVLGVSFSCRRILLKFRKKMRFARCMSGWYSSPRYTFIPVLYFPYSAFLLLRLLLAPSHPPITLLRPPYILFIFKSPPFPTAVPYEGLNPKRRIFNFISIFWYFCIWIIHFCQVVIISYLISAIQNTSTSFWLEFRFITLTGNSQITSSLTRCWILGNKSLK